MNNKEKIDNLKKINLLIKAGKTPDSMDLTSEDFPFEFIFGLGPEGMTPFEYELSGKAEGDEFFIRLNKQTIQENLRHLYADFPGFPNASDSLYLKIQIVKVVPAETCDIVNHPYPEGIGA